MAHLSSQNSLSWEFTEGKTAKHPATKAILGTSISFLSALIIFILHENRGVNNQSLIIINAFIEDTCKCFQPHFNLSLLAEGNPAAVHCSVL